MKYNLNNMIAIVIQGGEQRIGQQIFNFLEWLHTEKGIGTNQCCRIADPFFIEDKKLMNYWLEYNDRNNINLSQHNN